MELTKGSSLFADDAAMLGAGNKTLNISLTPLLSLLRLRLAQEFATARKLEQPLLSAAVIGGGNFYHTWRHPHPVLPTSSHPNMRLLRPGDGVVTPLGRPVGPCVGSWGERVYDTAAVTAA